MEVLLTIFWYIAIIMGSMMALGTVLVIFYVIVRLATLAYFQSRKDFMNNNRTTTKQKVQNNVWS